MRSRLSASELIRHQLGPRRVQTDWAGNVGRTCFSLPYGDGESCGETPTEYPFAE